MEDQGGNFLSNTGGEGGTGKIFLGGEGGNGGGSTAEYVARLAGATVIGSEVVIA
jgi:hypothetical protein